MTFRVEISISYSFQFVSQDTLFHDTRARVSIAAMSVGHCEYRKCLSKNLTGGETSCPKCVGPCQVYKVSQSIETKSVIRG